ncbi:MAG: hypothetical protein ABSF20_01300 [Smithella sp.]
MNAIKNGNKTANKKVQKGVKANVDKRKHGDPPPKKKYKIFLRNAEDLKRLMSVTINELRRGEVNPMVAGKIFYGATVMLQIFEQVDLAAQLKELERRAEEN